VSPDALTRRERQIMDVLYAAGRASAAEVRERMSDPPSYSSVRALLRILERKGHVRHEQDGPRYLYVPAVAPARARRAALSHLVRTFFQGSAERTVAALLESSDSRLSEAELDRLEQLIDQARRKGT
jgi:predicted transcriptional regulator